MATREPQGSVIRDELEKLAIEYDLLAERAQAWQSKRS
jgi:hypothetical protein